MIYIQTDDDGNIIQVVTNGMKPSPNGYEVESISDEILSNIFNYKYIEDTFVPIPSKIAERLQKLKEAKIQNMSDTCNMVIETGIDFNNEHYSLKSTDQINLMKLESIATLSPETQLFYHADNKLCRPFSNEEIRTLATMATLYVTCHTTYFNFFKAYINSLSTIDDVLNCKYGMILPDEYQNNIDAIVSGISPIGISFPIIEDLYDYSHILNDIDINDMVFGVDESEDVFDNTNTNELSGHFDDRGDYYDDIEGYYRYATESKESGLIS